MRRLVEIVAAVLVCAGVAFAAPVIQGLPQSLRLVGALNVGKEIVLSDPGTQPACDAEHVGWVWYDAYTGSSDDSLQFCNQSTGGAYAWGSMLGGSFSGGTLSSDLDLNGNDILNAATVTVGDSGLIVGGATTNSVPFQDTAGVLKLQNVDQLDATTTATITSALGGSSIHGTVGTNDEYIPVADGSGGATLKASNFMFENSTQNLRGVFGIEFDNDGGPGISPNFTFLSNFPNQMLMADSTFSSFFIFELTPSDQLMNFQPNMSPLVVVNANISPSYPTLRVSQLSSGANADNGLEWWSPDASRSYNVGVDASVSGAPFTISSNTAGGHAVLGTNNLMTMFPGTGVGIGTGTATPGSPLEVRGTTANDTTTILTVSDSAAATRMSVAANGTTTIAQDGSNVAVKNLNLTQASTGDATLQWSLSGDTKWAAGIDNSVAGNPWVLATAAGGTANLGTGNALSVTTAGDATLTGDLTIAGGDLTVGSSASALSDSAGVLTLSGLDALDATSAATVAASVSSATLTSGTISSTETTGDAFTITASSLTTGRAFYISSNSNSSSARTLAQILNNNGSATNTTLLTLTNNATGSGTNGLKIKGGGTNGAESLITFHNSADTLVGSVDDAGYSTLGGTLVIGGTAKITNVGDLNQIANRNSALQHTLIQSSNTAAASVQHGLQVAGTSASDATYSVGVASGNGWVWGYDNSDNDGAIEFNATSSSFPGSLDSSPEMKLSSAGALTITGAISASNVSQDVTTTGTPTFAGLTNTSAATTGTAETLTANSVSSGVGKSITADGLTTGNALSITSNSSDATARNLVSIVNDHASSANTTALRVKNDATGTNAITMSLVGGGNGASEFLWKLSNSTPTVVSTMDVAGNFTTSGGMALGTLSEESTAGNLTGVVNRTSNVAWSVQNQSTSAASSASMAVHTWSSTSGDAVYSASVQGAGLWTFGVDNSDGDNFEWNYQSATSPPGVLDDSEAMKLTSGGLLTITDDMVVLGGDIATGAAVASTLFPTTTTGTVDIAPLLSTGAMTVGTASSTSTLGLGLGAGSGLVTIGSTTRNVVHPGTVAVGTATASSVPATIYNSSSSTDPLLKLEQASTGYAYQTFVLTSGKSYALGILNDSSDAFNLSYNASGAPVLGTAGETIMRLSGSDGAWHMYIDEQTQHGIMNYRSYYDGTSPPGVATQHARGTDAARRRTQANDYLAIFSGGGAHAADDVSSATVISDQAWVRMKAREAFTSTARGTEIDFATISDATTTATTRATIYEGLVMTGATGGDKGAGTINATAVYDDNVLLTDHVFECRELGYAFDGQPCDALTLDDAAEFAAREYHLPTIDGRETWESTGKFSLGKLVTQLWETVETHFIYLVELRDALNSQQSIIKMQQSQIDTLTKRLSSLEARGN